MLRESILKYANGSSASVVSCVGCLTSVKIRLADESQSLDLDGPLEVLSLTGTLADTHAHLHIAVADRTGKVTGGHLVEGVVSYTCEVCCVQYPQLSFTREFDPNTGFTELVVKERQK